MAWKFDGLRHTRRQFETGHFKLCQFFTLRKLNNHPYSPFRLSRSPLTAIVSRRAKCKIKIERSLRLHLSRVCVLLDYFINFVVLSLKSRKFGVKIQGSIVNFIVHAHYTLRIVSLKIWREKTW